GEERLDWGGGGLGPAGDAEPEPSGGSGASGASGAVAVERDAGRREVHRDRQVARRRRALAVQPVPRVNRLRWLRSGGRRCVDRATGGRGPSARRGQGGPPRAPGPPGAPPPPPGPPRPPPPPRAR